MFQLCFFPSDAMFQTQVVELLVELKSKAQGDLQSEAAMMEDHAAWADNEETVTPYAIKVRDGSALQPIRVQ